MGDTGSLLLGFTVAWLIIKFIDVNATLPDNEVLQANAAISIGISSIIIPLFDTLRVFTIRLWKKKSPFSPDKNHLHHIIIRAFKISHGRAAIILFGINISFFAIAWQLRKLNDNFVLLILLVVLLSAYLLFTRKMRSMTKALVHENNKTILPKRRSVVK